MNLGIVESSCERSGQRGRYGSESVALGIGGRPDRASPGGGAGMRPGRWGGGR